MRRWAGAIGLAAAVVAAAGCIGTTSRESFDREIAARGGGFTSELPLEAVEAVADRLGAEDFDLRSMIVAAASSQMVTMEVRDPAAPANLDQYVVRGGDIDSVEPIRLSASDDLDAQTFPVSSLALDRIEQMVDTALAEFDRPGGFVASVTVTEDSAGEGVFHLTLESDRSSGVASFSAAGELIQLTQS